MAQRGRERSHNVQLSSSLKILEESKMFKNELHNLITISLLTLKFNIESPSFDFGSCLFFHEVFVVME